MNTPLKSLIVYIICCAFACLSFNASAQYWQRTTHVAIESTTGIDGFATICADAKTKVRARSRGVALGIAIGNNLLKARVRLGRYTPTTFSKLGGRLIESELDINFYPLEFLRTRDNILDLYIITGCRFSSIKAEFFSSQTKTSIARVFGQLAGMGTEMMVSVNRRSVVAFSEILFSNPISASASPSEVNNAWEYKCVAVNFGIRIGTMKTERKGRAPKVF
jgi:hypothetical protein